MRITLLSLLYISLTAWSGVATAQTLDRQFRPAEVYKTGSIKAVAADDSGGAWVLGSFDYANGAQLPDLAHYTANGLLDPAFQPPTLSTTTRQQLRGVQALPNGRVLLLGEGTLTVGSYSSPNLLILEADGQPDPTFAPPAPFTPSGSRLAIAVARQPDGKFVVGGSFMNYAGSGRGGVVRLLPSGALDLSFTPPGNQINAVRALLIQPDGRIVVGGGGLYYNGSWAASGLDPVAGRRHGG